jgi:hypothetical protein
VFAKDLSFKSTEDISNKQQQQQQELIISRWSGLAGTIITRETKQM